MDFWMWWLLVVNPALFLLAVLPMLLSDDEKDGKENGNDHPS